MKELSEMDLIGKKFGNLVVVGYAGTLNKDGRRLILCKCNCGKALCTGWKITTTYKLVSGKIKSCGAPTTYEFNGENLTIDELSNLSGIEKHKLRFRLYSGKTVEEALDVKSRVRNKLYSYNGKHYTAKEIEREFDINCATFRDRLKRGWTVKEAIETSVKNNANHYNYDGELYTVGQIERKFGVDGSAFRSRLRNGWTVKDAIEKPVKRYSVQKR